MAKRANGEATITKRKDRGTWRARWTEGFDSDGKQIRRSVTGKTRAEVVEKMAAIRVSTHEDFDTTTTLAIFLDDWNEAQRSKVAQTTAIGYARISRLYIVPELGGIKLGDLRARRIEWWMQALLDRGLSPATVKQARSVLRRALKYAVRDGLIRMNPASADFVDGVRETHKEGQSMTKDQAHQLIDWLHAYRPCGLVDGTFHAYDPYALLCHLLLSTGLRKGEALALRWGDFEGWVNGAPTKLSVRRSLKEDVRGATYTGSPKTDRSRRTVYLTPEVASMFAPYRKGDEIVFWSQAFTHLDPRKTNRVVQGITEAAGIGRWTPHSFRHTAASLLMSAGVPLKAVSEQLGHSSIRVTADVYGHLLTEDRQQIADAFSRVLKS